MTQSSPINVSHFDCYFQTYSLRYKRKKEKMGEELIERKRGTYVGKAAAAQ